MFTNNPRHPTQTQLSVSHRIGERKHLVCSVTELAPHSPLYCRPGGEQRQSSGISMTRWLLPCPTCPHCADLVRGRGLNHDLGKIFIICGKMMTLRKVRNDFFELDGAAQYTENCLRCLWGQMQRHHLTESFYDKLPLSYKLKHFYGVLTSQPVHMYLLMLNSQVLLFIDCIEINDKL